VGLYLYTNGDNNQHFDKYTGPGLGDNPEYDSTPVRVNGTPYDDTITFDLDMNAYYKIHSWFEGIFATAVTQRRLVTGELVLEADRGEILRACWDVCDLRTGVSFTETATGVIVATGETRAFVQNWQLTLYRGDYLLRNGVLEASTKSCGGG
jgi:hypothetical protein